MGFWGGVVKRAGERAREKSLLELQDEQERRKQLADFYLKWSQDDKNQPWSRDTAAERYNQVNMTPWDKKLDKDLTNVESLIRRPTPKGEESGRYTPEQLSSQGAEAAALAARRTGEETWPTRQKEIRETKRGTPIGTTREVTGQFLLDKGMNQVSGQPVSEKSLYDFQEMYDAPPFIAAKPSEPGGSVYYDYVPDENGMPKHILRFRLDKAGNRQYIDQPEGTVPFVSGMASTETQAGEAENPFAPGATQSHTTRSRTMGAQPLPPGVRPEEAFKTTGGSISIRQQPSQPTFETSPLPRPVRTPQELSTEFTTQGTQENIMSTLPPKEALDAITGPDDPARLGALDAFRNLTNFYPSDMWESRLAELKPENLDPLVRGEIETIKDKIRDVLNDPRRMQDEDLKGKQGTYVRKAMGALGIPIPTKPDAQVSDKAAYANVTLMGIQQLRQMALNNPKFIGAVRGRAVEAMGRIGVAPFMDFVDQQTAQEIVTRQEYFLVMEAKVLMGSRPAVSWAKELKKVTATAGMTLNQFLGSLNAAEQHALNNVKDMYQQMYGAHWKEMMPSPNAPFMPGAPKKGDKRLDPKTGEYEMALTAPNGDLWWGKPQTPDAIETGPYVPVEKIWPPDGAVPTPPPPGR